MNYKDLCAQMEALLNGVTNDITVLSNASALLMMSLSDINWAGFYLAEGDKLLLGPFQGKPACTVIQKGKGVCGTAYETDSTVLVKDVHQFPGHIACDSASRSEIVIPLHKNGSIYGVLDIDSPSLARFDTADKEGLEALASMIEKAL